jgi:hypothetical protein
LSNDTKFYDSLHQVQLSKQKALPPRLHEQMGDDTKSGHIVRLAKKSIWTLSTVAASSFTVVLDVATDWQLVLDLTMCPLLVSSPICSCSLGGNEEAATVDKVQMDFFANLDSVIKTGGEK